MIKHVCITGKELDEFWAEAEKTMTEEERDSKLKEMAGDCYRCSEFIRMHKEIDKAAKEFLKDDPEYIEKLKKDGHQMTNGIIDLFD